MPTFSPSPPKRVNDGSSPALKLQSTGSPSPPAGQRQATLFELRFGPRRAKLWPTAAGAAEVKVQSSCSSSGKELKKEDDEGGASDADSARPQEDQALRGPGRPAKRFKSEDSLQSVACSQSSDPASFLQVTRPGFVQRYAVAGLPGADVYYQPSWVDARTAEAWRRELDALPHWYRPKLKVYGREITQSRSIAAFSTEPGLELKYSGHPVQMHAPFPPLLDEIARRLCCDDCLGREVRFNHAMLNRYEDGSVYIGKHSDNLENRVIVTVSLGADRAWIMERRKPRGAPKGGGEAGPKKRWTLGNGSVLVMQGDTQRLYTHEIPKELRIKQPRISITFRQLVYE